MQTIKHSPTHIHTKNNSLKCALVRISYEGCSFASLYEYQTPIMINSSEENYFMFT